MKRRTVGHIVGEAVVEAIRQGKPLEDLPLDELQKFSPVIDEDVYPILSLQSCLDKRAAKGGVTAAGGNCFCAGAVRVICLYCSPESGELTIQSATLLGGSRHIRQKFCQHSGELKFNPTRTIICHIPFYHCVFFTFTLPMKIIFSNTSTNTYFN